MLVIVSVVFHYSPGQSAEIFNYTIDDLLQERLHSQINLAGRYGVRAAASP